jgi:hypothetical protein
LLSPASSVYYAFGGAGMDWGMGFFLEEKNERGRAYDICVDPSKLRCLTSKDYVGCTSCSLGDERYNDDPVFSSCHNQADSYRGEPRMRRLLGEP